MIYQFYQQENAAKLFWQLNKVQNTLLYITFTTHNNEQWKEVYLSSNLHTITRTNILSKYFFLANIMIFLTSLISILPHNSIFSHPPIDMYKYFFKIAIVYCEVRLLVHMDLLIITAHLLRPLKWIFNIINVSVILGTSTI